MKRLLLLGLLLSYSGCAYNSTIITGNEGAVDVKCYVDKPVTVDTLRSLGQGATVPVSAVPGF